MVQLYGVSRRRSRDVLAYLKDQGAIVRQSSIGSGSRYVVDQAVAKTLLLDLDTEGARIKKSGW
jgi:hypothetical protein